MANSLEEATNEMMVIAIEALRRIQESDPIPACYIARSALDQIQVIVDREEREGRLEKEEG